MQQRNVSKPKFGTLRTQILRGFGSSVVLTGTIQRRDRMSALAALRRDAEKIGSDMTIVVERERANLKASNAA